MGCATSRVDNEDTVSRCRERCRLMKQAVHSRHNFAAAHSDYLRSLRLTASALSTFAKGESLAVSEQTPAIIFRQRNPSFRSHATPAPAPAPPPPPPPSEPVFSRSSSSATRSKAPHTLSQSSRSSSPRRKPAENPDPFPSNFYGSSFYSTPSQASSVWNWENFYPPSPPGSDFYRHRKEKAMEEEETAREEVHCSDWGDHYSSTSSDTGSDEETGTKSEVSRSKVGSSVDGSIPAEVAGKYSRRRNDETELGSSVSWNGGDFGLQMVIRHKNLAEIVAALEEYFEKAADSGKDVSDLLETSRAQFDQSFRQLRKTVYHSSNIFSNLSSSWTSKPPLVIRYSLETSSLEDSGGRKSQCSTLERLYAWEKKLYEEVKAREKAKIEHEKKLSSLQSQEYRGNGDVKLDKTKASIKKLQSLILVESQAVNTTSSAITKVRDIELGPQLAELCLGLMQMWRLMNQFHEIQNHIVQQVRGLVLQHSAGESTSDLHRQATQHLEVAVNGWYSSFMRLIKYQREYMHSLHGWLRLTFAHLENSTDKASDSSVTASHLYVLCDEWKQALERLPDTVAAESINSFRTVVHAIYAQQSEEVKAKKRAETVAKELEKKTMALRNVEKKFYSSYSLTGINIPGSGGSDSGQVLDARDPLRDKRMEVEFCRRRAEEEKSRHVKAVQVTRDMTLNNIQTGLPGVFQALTSFSGLCCENFDDIYNRIAKSSK